MCFKVIVEMDPAFLEAADFLKNNSAEVCDLFDHFWNDFLIKSMAALAVGEWGETKQRRNSFCCWILSTTLSQRKSVTSFPVSVDLGTKISTEANVIDSKITMLYDFYTVTKPIYFKVPFSISLAFGKIYSFAVSGEKTQWLQSWKYRTNSLHLTLLLVLWLFSSSKWVLVIVEIDPRMKKNWCVIVVKAFWCRMATAD